jgi:hypothetical protein
VPPRAASSTIPTGCSSAAGPGAWSRTRRRSRPLPTSGCSATGWPRTRRTSTSPPSRWTRSRRSRRAHPAAGPARRGPVQAGAGAAAALRAHPVLLGHDRHLRLRPLAAGGPALADHRRPRVRLPEPAGQRHGRAEHGGHARDSNAELTRVAAVLDELANRSRITRRSSERGGAERAPPRPALPARAAARRWAARGSPGRSRTSRRCCSSARSTWPACCRTAARAAGCWTCPTTLGPPAKRVIRRATARGLWDQPAGAFPQLRTHEFDRGLLVLHEAGGRLPGHRGPGDQEPPLRSEPARQIAATCSTRPTTSTTASCSTAPRTAASSCASSSSRIGVELRRARAVRRRTTRRRGGRHRGGAAQARPALGGPPGHSGTS